MIYSFSGTGNSKYIADELSKITGESLFCINDALKNGIVPNQVEDDDKIIIVCPTYAWRIPKVVDAWIRKTDFGKRKKIWFVMSCGGEIGNAAKYNRALADTKGFTYMGSKGIKLPDNYIIMFNPESQETADILFKNAVPEIESAAKAISEGAAFALPRNNLYDRTMSAVVNPMFYKKVKADLFVTGTDCIGCGLCERKCPLNNISLKDGKPAWGKSCTHCMACISYCPKNAIEYGNKTTGKRRYTIESYKVIETN